MNIKSAEKINLYSSSAQTPQRTRKVMNFFRRHSGLLFAGVIGLGTTARSANALPNPAATADSIFCSQPEKSLVVADEKTSNKPAAQSANESGWANGYTDSSQTPVFTALTVRNHIHIFAMLVDLIGWGPGGADPGDIRQYHVFCAPTVSISFPVKTTGVGSVTAIYSLPDTTSTSTTNPAGHSFDKAEICGIGLEYWRPSVLAPNGGDYSWGVGASFGRQTTITYLDSPTNRRIGNEFIVSRSVLSSSHTSVASIYGAMELTLVRSLAVNANVKIGNMDLPYSYTCLGFGDSRIGATWTPHPLLGFSLQYSVTNQENTYVLNIGNGFVGALVQIYWGPNMGGFNLTLPIGSLPPAK